MDDARAVGAAKRAARTTDEVERRVAALQPNTAENRVRRQVLTTYAANLRREIDTLAARSPEEIAADLDRMHADATRRDRIHTLARQLRADREAGRVPPERRGDITKLDREVNDALNYHGARRAYEAWRDHLAQRGREGETFAAEDDRLYRLFLDSLVGSHPRVPERRVSARRLGQLLQAVETARGESETFGSGGSAVQRGRGGVAGEVRSESAETAATRTTDSFPR